MATVAITVHGDPIAPVILGVTSILAFAVIGKFFVRLLVARVDSRRDVVQFYALQYHLITAYNAGSEIPAFGAQQTVWLSIRLCAALAATHDNIGGIDKQFGIGRDAAGSSERVGVSQKIDFDARQRPDSEFDARHLCGTTLFRNASNLVEQRQAD